MAVGRKAITTGLVPRAIQKANLLACRDLPDAHTVAGAGQERLAVAAEGERLDGGVVPFARCQHPARWRLPEVECLVVRADGDDLIALPEGDRGQSAERT